MAKILSQEPQYILKEGKPTAVILDIRDYEELLEWINNNQEDPFYQALLLSGFQDTNGDLLLKRVNIPQWDANYWSADFVPNLDPEIKEGMAQLRKEEIIEAFEFTASNGACLDGVMFDNFMSNPGMDTNPEHFALIDHTLTYSINTYQPVIPIMASTSEYLSYLRKEISSQFGEEKGFTANCWGLGTLNFLVRFLDGIG